MKICRTLVSIGSTAIVLIVALGGCGSRLKALDPLIVAGDNKVATETRIAAMKQAREAATGDPERIALTARTLKEIVWETGQTDQARVAAMKQLLNDPDPSVAADARQLGKLILPSEQSRAMVALLSATAGERGWKEYGPALVRAYARPVKGVKDEERTERVALTALGEGKELTEVIFGIFLDPGEESGVASIKGTRLDARQRVRSDAWDLLARLDRHGDRRAQLLGHSLANAPNDPILTALAAGHDELRVIPLAGEELFWLCAMRDFTKQGRKGWWDACKQAIAQTPQGETIRLRHLEAIRWAAAHRSAWLSQSQDALIAELRNRLKGRETAARSWGNGSPTYRERLDDAHLSWADALATLVLDEAIHSQGPPAVAERLIQYASQDRQDPTSEYGGLIVLREDDRCADALLYPPRAGQRRGDQQFVASDDMLEADVHSLAHFHFHVQKWANAEYAGPSDADIEYASRFGRTCVVFTGIREGELDADLYFSPARGEIVVVDLGAVHGLGISDRARK